MERFSGVGGTGAPRIGRDEPRKTEQPKESTKPDLVSKEARVESLLAGSKVSLRSVAGKVGGPKDVREQSQSRMSKFWSGFKTFWKGVGYGSLVLLSLAVPVTTPSAIARFRDAFSSSLSRARREAELLRQTVGADIRNGVLSREIPTKNFGAVPLKSVMEQYRRDIGSSLTAEQMRRYINMGERIVSALNAKGDYNGGSITINLDGRPYTIKPNLDTARAISWFLQAKAVADNASKDLDPIVLNRGSMVVKDPGQKLFKFLRSAPNTYGRASTHFGERSASPRAKTGFAGFFAGLGGQPGQYGIEDFDSKMPSGRGCLLFDQLRASDPRNPTPQMFLKWESAGMPTVFGGGTHADDESGWVGKVSNRWSSFLRCLAHTFNFIKSRSGGASQKWGVHREAVNKDGPWLAFNRFGLAVDQAKKDLNLTEDFVNSITRDAERRGLSFMVDTLHGIIEAYRREQKDPSYPNLMLTAIEEFSKEMGRDVGIERRGAEIHVDLSTDYLGRAEVSLDVLRNSMDFLNAEWGGVPPDDYDPEGFGPPSSENIDRILSTVSQLKQKNGLEKIAAGFERKYGPVENIRKLVRSQSVDPKSLAKIHSDLGKGKSLMDALNQLVKEVTGKVRPDEALSERLRIAERIDSAVREPYVTGDPLKGGIPNVGNSCYLSAGLSLAANCTPYYQLFTEGNITGKAQEIAKYYNDNIKPQGKTVMTQKDVAQLAGKVRNVLENIQDDNDTDGKTMKELRDMMYDLGFWGGSKGSQQDVSEVFFTKLIPMFDPDSTLNLTETITRDPGGGGEKTVTSDSHRLVALPIDGSESLEQALEAYRKPQTIQYGAGNAEETRTFRGTPPVLTFALNRFMFDRDASRASKDYHEVEMPERFEFNGKNYRLQAVVHHQGGQSTQSGHYTALTRSGDEWHDRNDSNVRRLAGFEGDQNANNKVKRNTGYIYSYVLEE